jgi:nicotinamidase-related amidase
MSSTTETRTSSNAVHDPLADQLITPQSSALVLIDYQPDQVSAVRSMDQDLLVKNIVSTVKLVKLFGVPILHSTVNVASGPNPAANFGSRFDLAEHTDSAGDP